MPRMPYCGQCGASAAPSARSCVACGAPLRPTAGWLAWASVAFHLALGLLSTLVLVAAWSLMVALVQWLPHWVSSIPYLATVSLLVSLAAPWPLALAGSRWWLRRWGMDGRGYLGAIAACTLSALIVIIVLIVLAKSWHF